MNLKKFISGVSALAIAASAFAAFAVTASADSITYTDTSSNALSTYEFSQGSSTSYSANLTNAGSVTLNFTFKDESATTATTGAYKYRPTITVGGKQIVILPGESNKVDTNKQWPSSATGYYYINWKPYTSKGNNPLTVAITATLSEGKANSLSLTTSAEAGTYNINLGNEAVSLADLTLETAVNESGAIDSTVSLTNFSAAITSYTPCDVSAISGGDYKAYVMNADGEDASLQAFKGGNALDKTVSAAEAAKEANVTLTYLASKTNTFTVTPNNDTITKVTVNHYDNSDKTGDPDKTNELEGTWTGAGSITFTIVATVDANDTNTLKDRLEKLSAGYFGVTVTKAE